jgi:transcriptional regulator with XRE-family HTH domain
MADESMIDGAKELRGYPMQDADHLVAVLRERRMALGLSLSEVARRAGRSKGWLSQVERGYVAAGLPALMDVLDAIGLDVALVPRRTPDGG